MASLYIAFRKKFVFSKTLASANIFHITLSNYFILVNQKWIKKWLKSSSFWKQILSNLETPFHYPGPLHKLHMCESNCEPGFWILTISRNARRDKQINIFMQVISAHEWSQTERNGIWIDRRDKNAGTVFLHCCMLAWKDNSWIGIDLLRTEWKLNYW